MTTTLITGASSGIGKAIAQAVARPEAKLILTGRRRALLEELAASLPCPAHIACFDIRDRAALTSALESLPGDFAHVDALINNAGLALGLVPSQEGSIEDWETMVQTNIMGLVTATRLLLPGMIARGRGHIVNISSIAGTYAYPGGNVYGATKAFVTQFSLNLRADLVGQPIRVTNIEPGMVETEFSTVRFKGDAARAASVYAGVNALTAEDIAACVAFALAQPAHVNINRIEVMPTRQAPGGLAVARQGA